MAYPETEQRLIDPQRDRLSPEEHAARLHALNPVRARQFEDTGPEVKFGGGTYRGKPYTGDDIRKALRNFLFRLDPKMAPEVAELLLSLERGRSEFIETLKFGKFLQPDGKPRDGDTPPPSLEQIQASFSPDELFEAARFEVPILQMLPEGVTFGDIVAAIDANETLKGQENTYVDEVYGERTQRTPKAPLRITGYRPVIVEGAREMPVKDGDDVNDTWGNRVNACKTSRQGKPYVRGTDRIRAGFLMLDSYRTKNPIDRETATLLDDDSALSDSGVPCVGLRGWDDGCQPRFSAVGPGNRGGYGRFRSSVGGDVLLT